MFDYDVYALCGDGCMMEGVSGEAASLAGHLKLGNLCWIYDNNNITIEGNTSWRFQRRRGTRFIGYGWNVTARRRRQRSGDAGARLQTFRRTTDRPTLIIVDSHIAYGAPHKQDTSAAHGEPLGEEEIRLTKRNYGWPEDAKFLVPDGVYEHFRGMGKRGQALRAAWMEKFANTKKEVSGAGRSASTACSTASFPTAGTRTFPRFPPTQRHGRTRFVGKGAERHRQESVPWLIGGAADLAPSTKTRLTFEGAGDFEPETTAAAICTSASASTPWVDPERLSLSKCALRLGLSDFQRLCAGPIRSAR
jgi:transketolase